MSRESRRSFVVSESSFRVKGSINVGARRRLSPTDCRLQSVGLGARTGVSAASKREKQAPPELAGVA